MTINIKIQLYITISEPNNAIEMYKNADRPDDMIRLISQFHSDELQVFFLESSFCIQVG